MLYLECYIAMLNIECYIAMLNIEVSAMHSMNWARWPAYPDIGRCFQRAFFSTVFYQSAFLLILASVEAHSC